MTPVDKANRVKKKKKKSKFWRENKNFQNWASKVSIITYSFPQKTNLIVFSRLDEFFFW